MKLTWALLLISTSGFCTDDPSADWSLSVNTSSEVSSRSNSPSLPDEAVFTWHVFVTGDPDTIALVFDQNMTVEQTRLVGRVLEQLSDDGNHYAQQALVRCWIDGSFGLYTTQGNQGDRLLKLWEFANTNPLVHRYLIESYMEGYFGISPKKKSRVRRAKNFAQENLASPGVAELVIRAMKENLLAFKSRREYYRYTRDEAGKRICVEDKVDLHLIEFLAEQGHADAQVFLIECYMDGKYGADFSDKQAFKLAMNKMEALDRDNNPDLGALLISVWEQNLLGYGKKRKDERLKELARLRDKYDPRECYEYNPFSLLVDLTE